MQYNNNHTSYPQNRSPTTLIPPPPPPPHLLLIARWKGKQTRPRSDGTGHIYELAVRPDERIAPGRHIRLLAVSPIAYCSPEVPSDELDTYDPHVLGWVAETWVHDDGSLQARVTNTCRKNAVREVVLQVPRSYAAFELMSGGEVRVDEGLYEANADDTTEDRRRGPARRPEEGERPYGLPSAACVRPMRVYRECLGELCWNWRYELPLM
ncbi:hypothetical protein K466DRAFT_605357 [Polyporus arcularius HHB13444]|uniref:Uncharacterized protein n=1 Tax=Polyporus arcularius HHB13444 TaxID=1314778 RepID=A0A5C3NT44_9APHY|nr:hypothetical protein K466DRAFT_605357 [Polyporus arcularius HHB13444]